MRTIQEALGTGRAENSEAGTEHCLGVLDSPGACPIEMTGAHPPRPKRWVPHRKAEIVAAVRGGFLSLDQACERYALSIEEYLTWQRGIDLFGLAGLRVNKMQQRRHVRSHVRAGSTDH